MAEDVDEYIIEDDLDQETLERLERRARRVREHRARVVGRTPPIASDWDKVHLLGLEGGARCWCGAVVAGGAVGALVETSEFERVTSAIEDATCDDCLSEATWWVNDQRDRLAQRWAEVLAARRAAGDGEAG